MAKIDDVELRSKLTKTGPNLISEDLGETKRRKSPDP